MIDINLKVDGLEELRATLLGVRRQLPFATAKALTDLAKDVQAEEKGQLPKHIDRPTPFTQRAFGVRRATKRQLESRVFIKRIQQEYLRIQIEGGTRTIPGAGTGVPFVRKLNRYGNIPGRRKGLLKAGEFIANIKGISGVWKRIGRGVRLMVAFESKVVYKKRFDFYSIGIKRADKRWPALFSAALDNAIRTAR